MTARTHATIDPAAAVKLAKVAGMFGSAHAGERASAALKADTIVRRLGLTWTDLIVPIAATKSDGGSDWRQLAKFCADRTRQLTPRELEFIGAIARYRTSPSEKQMRWLTDIADRLHGSAA